VIQELNLFVRQEGATDIGAIGTPEGKPHNVTSNRLIRNRHLPHLPLLLLLLDHFHLPPSPLLLLPLLLLPFPLLLLHPLILLILLPDMMRVLLPRNKVNLLLLFLFNVHVPVVLTSDEVSVLDENVLVAFAHVPALLECSVQLLGGQLADGLWADVTLDYYQLLVDVVSADHDLWWTLVADRLKLGVATHKPSEEVALLNLFDQIVLVQHLHYRILPRIGRDDNKARLMRDFLGIEQHPNQPIILDPYRHLIPIQDIEPGPQQFPQQRFRHYPINKNLTYNLRNKFNQPHSEVLDKIIRVADDAAGLVLPFDEFYIFSDDLFLVLLLLLLEVGSLVTGTGACCLVVGAETGVDGGLLL